MELVCPAGSLPAFKAALNAGANAIYVGFKDETNARHFEGLNFNDRQAQKALSLARRAGVKLYLAINTYPQASGWERWLAAVDNAVLLGADALIIADMGLMAYVKENYPQQNIHLSVQGSSTNAASLQFYKDEFDIKRAVLPRVLSVKQVEQLCEISPVDLEVFGFGSLCIMVEGRCVLSSYITGESPNTCGVCSPAKAVRWEESDSYRRSRLNNVLIDEYQNNENASYPTLCKGRFKVNNNLYHALEQPTSLSTLEIIPQLAEMGIKAIKLEGRQRSPAYVEQVVRVWREALDHYQQQGENFTVCSRWVEQLDKVSEGQQTSLGPYSRPWQ